ncbi:MAG TPA: 8-amino-7-oxononanoate synthase [Pseudobdellovibrionaceae bacterium]|jgi:8-amino-7-oxononanoate synthase
MDDIHKEIQNWEIRGLLRELVHSSGIDFASNDYLGYSHNPVIHAKLVDFIKDHPKIGSTGSRLISGNSQHIEETEDFLAHCFSTEASLIFGSGYLANMGVCAALGGAETEFFSDELNHASIVDGIRISKSKCHIFRHNDLEHLNYFISKSSARRKVIVTESIFSMDGDFASLEQLLEIANKYDAYLFIDEAHATGVCGIQGLGRMLEFKFPSAKTILVHTCGKALGAYGAFVCGTSAIKRLLLNKARSQIFTTALPPFAVEHIRLAVAHLISDPLSVEKLKANILYSKGLFLRYQLKHSGSHIVPFLLGSNRAVLQSSQRLEKQGVFVKAIRSPTVRAGSERLRLTFKSTHSFEDIDKLCKILWELNSECKYIHYGN